MFLSLKWKWIEAEIILPGEEACRYLQSIEKIHQNTITRRAGHLQDHHIFENTTATNRLPITIHGNVSFL